MARMVSRFLGKSTYHQAELQGHMFNDGSIHYTFIISNRNLGQVSAEEKDEIIKSFDMRVVFDEEQQAKEDFELLGFVL